MMTQNAIKPAITSESQYRKERAICDAAAAYAESIMRDGNTAGKRVRNYLTADEAAAPVYAACSNDMRGRVEQWELLSNPPERFAAYIGMDGRTLTVWTGLPLGRAHLTSSWRIDSYMSSTMGAYRVTMGGRQYHGRSAGAGMLISLRETAASKRNRESSK